LHVLEPGALNKSETMALFEHQRPNKEPRNVGH